MTINPFKNVYVLVILIISVGCYYLSPIVVSAGNFGNEKNKSDPKLVGDIVCNDLNIWPAEAAGHVGMYAGNNKILEVLNDDTCIHMNHSVSDFKTPIKEYWGARYVYDKNLNEVINAGWEQRNFDPSYNITPNFREGKWEYQYRNGEWQLVKITAKFRCDTFVWYSYKKGIGYEIISSWGPFTPSNIWNSAPYARPAS